MKAFHLSDSFAMDIYFECGSSLLLANDHAFCCLDVDKEAFLFAFIYYDVEQMLWLFFTIVNKCCVIYIPEVVCHTFIPALSPNSLKMFFLYELKRSGENTQPWCTPFNFLIYPTLLFILITGVCSNYRFPISWMSFPHISSFFSISRLTLSKSLVSSI